MRNKSAEPATSERENEVIGGLDYDTIATQLSDETPTVSGARILKGRQIAAKRMTPQQVIEKLKHNHVIVLRRSWRGEIPRLILLIVGVTLVLFAMLENGFDLIASSLAIIFVPLTVLAAILHRRFNRKYIISYDSVSIIIGIVSWRLVRISIAIGQLRGIEIRRTITQRLLNIGDIQVSTALIDQPEFELAGIDNPHFYLAVLRLLHSLKEKDQVEQPSM